MCIRDRFRFTRSIINKSNQFLFFVRKTVDITGHNCELICSTDTALVLQQNRLRWYGHVLRKEDDDWVKKCMEYEVEGPRPREGPKRTWRQVVKEDCQARELNTEDAMDK